jgi:BMFP domain-containing protein YqiC
MISLIKTLSQNLYASIEASGMVDVAQKDLLKSLIEEQLKKVGFVSREEFDIQTKVLERSNQKIVELESKLQQLENLMQVQDKSEENKD